MKIGKDKGSENRNLSYLRILGLIAALLAVAAFCIGIFHCGRDLNLQMTGRTNPEHVSETNNPVTNVPAILISRTNPPPAFNARSARTNEYSSLLSNNVTILNLSGRTNIYTLDCSWHYLTNLNLSGCANLLGLDCFNNYMTRLDISSNTKLIDVLARQNPLADIVVWWKPPTNILASIHFIYDGDPVLSNP